MVLLDVWCSIHLHIVVLVCVSMHTHVGPVNGFIVLISWFIIFNASRMASSATEDAVGHPKVYCYHIHYSLYLCCIIFEYMDNLNNIQSAICVVLYLNVDNLNK